MKTFICEIEKDNQVHNAIVKADTKEQEVKDLSNNWKVIEINEMLELAPNDPVEILKKTFSKWKTRE